MENSSKLAFALLLVLLFVNEHSSVLCQRAPYYNLKGIKNKALFNNSFLNLTHMANVDQCFAMCLKDCRCISFQICQNIGCQLCSTTKDLTPSAFRETEKCVHYYFQRYFKKISVSQYQQDSPISEISCCATSNPCQNNGLCEAVSTTCQPKSRFRCKCQPGYRGELCEEPIRSCRGYNDGNRVAGEYTVFDTTKMKQYKVFCDFEPKSDMAWTLIQSYQLKNNGLMMKHIDFHNDYPLNEETPDWHRYRLSHSRMLSIQQDSSKWRMTCRFDTDGLNYTDYLRCSNDKVDIFRPEPRFFCREVEFINVRGYSCSNCTAPVFLKPNEQVHVDSSSTHACSLQVEAGLPCDGNGEDNFGLYDCVNPSHRCSASPNSTTQTWFGGK